MSLQPPFNPPKMAFNPTSTPAHFSLQPPFNPTSTPCVFNPPYTPEGLKPPWEGHHPYRDGQKSRS